MHTHEAPSKKKSSAVNLLIKIVAAGWFDIQQIAAELVVDERTVGRYLAGDLPMPPDRQVCLARFLIEKVPSLSRQGHNLLSRLKAQAAYSNSEIVTHQSAPPPRTRWY